MPLRQVGTVILGAGPCGLGAAWRMEQLKAHRLQDTYTVVDENVFCGGRASSITTPEGFTFDYGGHVLFPHEHYSSFTNLLNELIPRWSESVPVRGVWVDGGMIPTPVQRNIHRLSPYKLSQCLWGLWRLRARGKPSRPTMREGNLLEHLESNFGEPMTRLLMAPLNRKMWSHPPEALSSNWVTHRSGSREKNVPEVRIQSILKNWLSGRDDPSWSGETRVRYPQTGGSGAIWNALAQRIPAANKTLGRRVIRIRTGTKTLILSDGSEMRYQNLLSSIPLDVLLSLMADRPDLSARAASFVCASVLITGYGVSGPMPTHVEKVHALNVPDPCIPFWRVNFPSNFSPGNVPDPATTWSVLCETSMPRRSRNVDRQHMDLNEHFLRAMGILPRGAQVVSRWTSFLVHGYPVPFLGRDDVLASVQGELEDMGILSRGRFGGWKYEVSNQDHAFMQGVEALDRLISGKPETTYASH